MTGGLDRRPIFQVTEDDLRAETALRAQYESATDPIEKTFAALMLYNARGDVIDMAAQLRLFAVPPLRTVYEHLQSSLLQTEHPV